MASSSDHRTIIRTVKNRQNPYVQIHKGIFEDPRLSWKAKGLMGYFLSRPDDWQIAVGDLIKRSTDGRDSVYSGLRELKRYGYLQEAIYRDPQGRITAREYLVYEQPVVSAAIRLDPEKPDQAIPDEGTPDKASPHMASPYKENLPLLRTEENQGMNNNNLEGDPLVVDSPSTETAHLLQALERITSPVLSRKWLAQHGTSRIREVLEWVHALNPQNPGGFVRRALEEGWTEPSAVREVRERVARRNSQAALEAQLAQERAQQEAQARQEALAIDAAIAGLPLPLQEELETRARMRLQALTGLDPLRSPLAPVLLPAIRREVYREIASASGSNLEEPPA